MERMYPSGMRFIRRSFMLLRDAVSFCLDEGWAP